MYIYLSKFPNHSDGGYYYYVGQSTFTPEESTDYFGSGIFCQNYEKEWGKEYIRQNVKKNILRRDIKDRKTLDYLERLYIKNYRNKYGDLVVNIADGGGSGPCTEEKKKKLSEAAKNQWESPEFRTKIKEIYKSPEVKARKSRATKEMCKSPEVRARKSKASKEMWERDDYRAKMEKIRKSPEWRAKQSEVAVKGKEHPRYDHNVYTFRNLETGEIFTGTQRIFIETYKLDRSVVSGLIKGKHKSVKGWVMDDSGIKSFADIKRMQGEAHKGKKNYNFNINSIEQIYKRAYKAGDIDVSKSTFYSALKNANHKKHLEFTELFKKHTIQETTTNE